MNYLIENRIEPMLHNQPITSTKASGLRAPDNNNKKTIKRGRTMKGS
jgi:hypothetical protein